MSDITHVMAAPPSYEPLARLCAASGGRYVGSDDLAIIPTCYGTFTATQLIAARAVCENTYGKQLFVLDDGSDDRWACL